MFINIRNNIFRVEDIDTISLTNRLWIRLKNGEEYAYEHAKDEFKKLVKLLDCIEV